MENEQQEQPQPKSEESSAPELGAMDWELGGVGTTDDRPEGRMISVRDLHPNEVQR